MASIVVTDKDFASVVLESELPVLVDFWAPWCAPCKVVAPILEELSETYAGSLVIAKVDTDQSRRVAATYRIRSIPTLMLFKAGGPVQAIEGARPKAQLEELLKKWLPDLKPSGKPIKITVAALAARIESKLPTRVLDIRREIDFRRSHLRGAINVEPSGVAERLASLAADEQAVLMCRTGAESEALARQLVEQNHSVVSLEKGLLEWEGSGRPTFSTEEEAELILAEAGAQPLHA